VAINSY